MKARKNALRFISAIMCLLMLFCSCSSTIDEIITQVQESEAITQPPINADTNLYHVITKEEYLDKTTAGFLAQLVGFLSGYEFVTLSSGRCRVAMPDNWFEYINGPYAGNTLHKTHRDKHIKNTETGIYEVWFDDDFSVDVVNQYILSDMYTEKQTFSQKYISDGWIKYNVWDMGGGQRSVGAYGLISKYGYLPQFAGNTEYGNWYSFCTEAYLGTDTLGMNAAGMPETACDITGKFAQVTGDRDNVLWAQMFATMISIAYFEDDIPTIIKEASKVFPEDSWPLELIDYAFDLYEKYPNDWRTAYKELEARFFITDTKNTDTTINCAFVILDLLYGGGDFMTTCKIGSLAGYDCESTCGIALSVLAVIGGMEILPEETNTRIWQNGEGILTNLTTATDQGVWMIAEGLDDRMKIADVVDLYRKNFETILKQNGGWWDDNYYYIPKEGLSSYSTVKIANPEFEKGDLSGYVTKGNVKIDSTYPTKGLYCAKMTGESELYTSASDLEVGKTYTLTAFIRTSDGGDAFLFARNASGNGTVCASVSKTYGTPRYEAQSSVKRTLVFTATATDMDIGVILKGTDSDYAYVDSLVMIEIEETQAGSVTITNKTDNDVYTRSVSFEITPNTEGEVYLKLTFANNTNSATRIVMTVNMTNNITAGLYKTSTLEGAQSIDTVYIPICQGKETFRLQSSIQNGPISIYSASIVTLDSRIG